MNEINYSLKKLYEQYLENISFPNKFYRVGLETCENKRINENELLISQNEPLRTLLIGLGGAGKSTVLKNLLKEKEKRLIFFIRLKELFHFLENKRSSKFSFSDSLFDYVVQMLFSVSSSMQVYYELIKEIKESKIVWILDGFDEIEMISSLNAQTLRKELVEFISDPLSTNDIIVSSKNGKERAFQNYEKVVIKGFLNKDTVKSFISDRLSEDKKSLEKALFFLEKEKSLMEICINPLVSSIFIEFCKKEELYKNVKERITKGRIFRAIEAKLEGNVNKACENESFHYFKGCKRLLMLISFQMSKKNENILKLDDYQKILSEFSNENKLENNFQNVFEMCGIIKFRDTHNTSNENNFLEFGHSVYQQYFLSLYISKYRDNKEIEECIQNSFKSWYGSDIPPFIFSKLVDIIDKSKSSEKISSAFKFMKFFFELFFLNKNFGMNSFVLSDLMDPKENIVDSFFEIVTILEDQNEMGESGRERNDFIREVIDKKIESSSVKSSLCFFVHKKKYEKLLQFFGENDKSVVFSDFCDQKNHEELSEFYESNKDIIDLNKIVKYKKSALFKLMKSNIQFIDTFFDDISSPFYLQEALVSACKLGHYGYVVLFHGKGADLKQIVETTEKVCKTPLYYASRAKHSTEENYLEIVDYILECEAKHYCDNKAEKEIASAIAISKRSKNGIHQKLKEKFPNLKMEIVLEMKFEFNDYSILAEFLELTGIGESLFCYLLAFFFKNAHQLVCLLERIVELGDKGNIFKEVCQFVNQNSLPISHIDIFFLVQFMSNYHSNAKKILQKYNESLSNRGLSDIFDEKYKINPKCYHSDSITIACFRGGITQVKEIFGNVEKLKGDAYYNMLYHGIIGCVYAKNSEVLEFLLEKGANANALSHFPSAHRKGSYKSILEFALIVQDYKSASLLIKYGANVNDVNPLVLQIFLFLTCFNIIKIFH